MSTGARTYTRFEVAKIGRLSCYKLLTGSVVPRPIAWVTTRSLAGVINAAPFSQFMIAAYDPPLLAIAVGKDGARKKDTEVNIEATGEFVVNMVPEDAAEIVQACAAEYPPDISEVEALGLEHLPSVCMAVPRLAMSAIQFECRVHHMAELGNSQLIVGEVVMMHADSRIVDGSDKIKPDAYRTLARLGGRNYLQFGEIVVA